MFIICNAIIFIIIIIIFNKYNVVKNTFRINCEIKY